MSPPRRRVGCLAPGEPLPATTASTITPAMDWLRQQLLALAPGSQWGGTYANKPGYHNTRANNSSADYSVVDDPPDQGGPSNVAAAIDWTFPDAQAGNYDTIATYTKRLLASAQDPNDHRLDGWREFYGNADDDSYVEGWDCRYGYAVTSDSSHLWHLHLSENRDQAESYENKEALLSVLRGEDDVTAKDVWNYDVDPSGGSYTASGAQWTTMNRTGYLANEFAPQVLARLEAMNTTPQATQEGLRAILVAQIAIGAILAVVFVVALTVWLTTLR